MGKGNQAISYAGAKDDFLQAILDLVGASSYCWSW